MDAIPTTRSRLATALSIANTQRRSKYPVPTRFTSIPPSQEMGGGRRDHYYSYRMKTPKNEEMYSPVLKPLLTCFRHIRVVAYTVTHPVCTLSFQHARKPCDSNCRTACRTRADTEAHLEANHYVLGACCEACGDLKYGCRELSNATSGGPKPAGLAC
jgi:hypothetical protein